VADLNDAVEFLTDVLGSQPVRELRAPKHGVSTTFLRFGEISLELIQPSSVDHAAPGAIWPAVRFDHLAVEVDDLEDAIHNLGGQGVRFVGPPSDPNLALPVWIHGTRTVWTDPRTSCGLVCQLFQRVTAHS
jgi:catechol 2,3-dioxygenase-like lactoylglutathione lyase family enzyme